MAENEFPSLIRAVYMIINGRYDIVITNWK